MAAPTFVQEAETAFGTATSPKTSASIASDSVGDVLVSLGVGEDGGITTLIPTLTGETFTSQGLQGVGGATCRVDLRTAVIASAGAAETVSVARSGTATLWWGANILQFTASNGVGTAASNRSTISAAANLSLTTTQANSAIAIVLADFSATDPTAWTWQSVNGSGPTIQTSFRDSAHYSFVIGWYPDAGAIGAKTIGITQSFQWAIAAIEVKGAAAAAAKAIIFPSRTARNPLLRR